MSYCDAKSIKRLLNYWVVKLLKQWDPKEAYEMKAAVGTGVGRYSHSPNP